MVRAYRLQITARTLRADGHRSVELGIGSAEFGGPFSIWELKVIQEVVSLSVFTVFALVFMKSDTLRWNHLAGFLCLVLAVYFIFRK